MGTTSEAARNREFKGQRPKPRKDRDVDLRATFEHSNAVWELWELIPGEGRDKSKHFDHGGAWSNYKLIALPTHRGKANFWLAYNHEECRFAKVKAVEVLQTTEPVVYAWVLSAIDPDTFGSMV